MAQYGIITSAGILPVHEASAALPANSQLFPVASYIDRVTPSIYEALFGVSWGQIRPAHVIQGDGLHITNNTPFVDDVIISFSLKGRSTGANIKLKCTSVSSRWVQNALIFDPDLIPPQTFQSYAGAQILNGQYNKLFCVHYTDGLGKSIYVFLMMSYEGTSVFGNHIILNEEYMRQTYGDYIQSNFIADPDFTDETSDAAGYDGQGAHDHTSDTIGEPTDPVVSTSSVGFFHIYKVSSGLLSNLGQYLFPDILGSLASLDLNGILRAFASIFAYRDNIQYIVDLHAIPVNPATGGGEYIKVGALSTDITAPKVTNDYVNFDCGSISLPENFASFLDYTGTRARLFLPFVGFVDVKNEYWQGGTLRVKYKFNVVDGSFMAYVFATSSKSRLSNSMIGQYGGSACIHFPVLAQSYGAMAAGLVTGGMSLAAAGASGNVAGVATSALTAINFQPQGAQSNNYNCSTSFLGGRRPYMIIERVVPSFSAFYNVENGVPLNVVMNLGNVKGFTIIENPILKLTCDEEEKAEIYDLLKSGVIF